MAKDYIRRLMEDVWPDAKITTRKLDSDDRRPAVGTPCTDPAHGSQHHWCSEIGGYTGGLITRRPSRKETKP